MIDWYLLFLGAIFILWLISSTRDRSAARIVLLATIGSELIVDGITQHFAAAWKLAIPCSVETLTILCLLRWAPNRTGYTQAALLGVAWLAHVGCYVDVVQRDAAGFVYVHYETIIGLVAIGQLLAFYDTVAFNLRRLVDWIASLGARDVGTASPASGGHPVLRITGIHKL